jgi:hypothetical protein
VLAVPDGGRRQRGSEQRRRRHCEARASGRVRHVPIEHDDDENGSRAWAA